MSLYGSFAKHKDLVELASPRVTNGAVVTAATRQLAAIRNISGVSALVKADFTVLATLTDLTSTATELNLLASATVTAVELHYNDITTLGTAQASKTLTVDSAKKLIWTTTSASTSNPMAMTNTMTGAGTTGGRVLIEMVTAVTLGGWANAVKAYANFGTAGAVTGLGSALNAEIQVGTQASVTGTYAAVEMELVLATGGGGSNTKTAFMYMNTNGAAITNFDDNGYLFIIGTGVTVGGGKFFDNNAGTAINNTHSLRCNIDGVDYFIPLHTSSAFGV